MASSQLIAQPESHQVDEIEQLVAQKTYCTTDEMVFGKNVAIETGPRNATENVRRNENVPSSPNNINPQATPDIGRNSLPNSDHQNLSIKPSSMHVPVEDSNQQIDHNPVSATEQSEEGRSYMESYQQSRGIKKEIFPSQEIAQGDAPIITTRPPDQNRTTSLQHSDNIPEQNRDSPRGKKVFILHSIPENDPHNEALLSFATALRDSGINVSVDLFEQDKTHDNWSMWYEREISNSNVVLCIITPDFYRCITEQDRIKGYAVYNLMSDSSKDIAFRAVFLDTSKNMEHVPLSMRGATCYCISSKDLNVHDNEEFTNLYAFLSGQNRIEKPKLGNMIKLVPKKSRFGQVRSHHPSINTDMMYQQRSPINAPQSGAPASSCKDGQAKFIFQLLSKDSTPVKSLSVQKFFATLSKNMTAKWDLFEGIAE